MDLDGLAISIGGSVCRFFVRNGHYGLNSLVCSDGYFSAGWKVFGATVMAILLAFWMTRLMRPS